MLMALYDSDILEIRQEVYQQCLDIVTRASDYMQAHPDSPFDIFDVLARIITDIQVASLEK